MVTLWQFWTVTMTDKMMWLDTVLPDLAHSCVHEYHNLLQVLSHFQTKYIKVWKTYEAYPYVEERLSDLRGLRETFCTCRDCCKHQVGTAVGSARPGWPCRKKRKETPKLNKCRCRKGERENWSPCRPARLQQAFDEATCGTHSPKIIIRG